MLVFTMRLTAQQKKNLYYLVPLIVLLIGTFLFYFLAIRVRPNDKIITNSEGVALFANENPTFEVQFGEKEKPDGQWIRFEAQVSNDNPFSSEEKKNIFTKIADIFTPKNKSGIEMSLRGVDFSETKSDGKAQQDEEIQKVADILGTDNIQTSTVLTSMGREIGKNEGDQIISKQTIVNQEVADGIDLEYQVLKGLGLKEEIVINDLEAYRNSCDEGCKLPLNEFVFDLKVDDGVVLKKGWFTVDGKSSEVYYFVNGNGKYLAHFLPSYAVDDAGNKTYEVGLTINEIKVGNYEAKVTVSSDWLLNENRQYPIRIDPSIVHDDTTDFSGGVFNRTESVAGPKIQTKMGLGFDCTGGTTTSVNGFAIHTFATGGTFQCRSSKNIEILVVGGGGGGGSTLAGGGGGGGGVMYSSSYAVTGNQSYTAVVGTGGASMTNGGNSSFGTLTAVGGGHGGGGGAYNTGVAGTAGGSGGGGSGDYYVSRAGGGGTSGQGYAGGASAVYGSSAYTSGGGGGAGGVGGTSVSTASGNGGAGVQYSISGEARYYAAGGGGSVYREGGTSTRGIGGSSIGGSGQDFLSGTIISASTSGTENTGSGGGGGAATAGSSGGSGVIIIRYAQPLSPYSEYISSSLNLGSATSGMTMSWLASGVNTSNGETPYSTTGMVAQWNFNETSGTTAVSGGTCGTSCNGTLTNMTTTGQDAAVNTGWTANNRRWGSGAVMFDGSNDSVSVPQNANINNITTKTVCTWVNLRSQLGSDASGSHIVNKGDVWFIATDSTNSRNIFGQSFSTTSGRWSFPLMETGKWNYLCAVYDRSSVSNDPTIYVNGVPQLVTEYSTPSGTASDDSASNLIWGSSLANGRWFAGSLDSTSIYSRALSANEIISNYQAGNIEFQYRTSTDNSTWSNWTSYNDGALMFDGNDDYVSVGDIAAVDALTSFSTCAWVNNDTMTADSMIWSKVDNSTWSGIMFVKDIVGQVSGRTNMYKIWVGQNSAAAFIEGATNSATTGAWQHVCATFTANNSTGLHLYINGVEDANSPVSTVGITGFDSGANTLSIGRYNPSAGTYLDGSIDNIQIYNRVLSGSEITSNYTASDFETPYSSTGLLAFWKFNELSDTTAVSGGTCGIACNGILTNFTSTTSRDSSTTSGWTAKTKKGSDYPEYSFDNPYLYNPSDTGLVGYWPMDEVNGSGAYIKDVSTPFAVGGTVTYSGGYTIHTFKTSDTFVVNGSGKVEVLVVGGGGGGGDFYGGGGGAGGYQYNSGFSLTNGSYSVTIGNGGANNASGGNSVFSTITALGGGRGGLGNPQSAADAGGNGGSGGGMGGYIPSTNGTTPPLGYGSQGYNGGTGSVTGVKAGAGGGGAGGVGGNASGATSGNGGVGVANSISGTSVYYAGGGGGGNGNNTGAGTGGSGGGGNGAAALYPASANGSNGIANTGGGGGGAAQVGTGGTGGSGVVIVRYPSSYTATTTDTIGDLTPTGTAYLNGKSGGARNFNGSSDYLSCTDANCGGAGKLDAMTGSISISAWVKPTTCSTVSVSPAIIDKFDTSASKGYMIYNEYYSGANLWTFYDPVNGYTRSTTPCVAGVWTYITAVYDSSALTKKIYINGKLEATSTSQNPFGDSASDFNIGRYRGSSYYYNGIIDEVRIFNTALSASTISSDYISGIANKGSVLSQTGSSLKLEGTGSTKLISGANGTDPNTVGLWHMDERSGTSAYIKDSSVNANNGTPTGTTYSNSGKVAGVRSFNGSGDYINVISSSSLSFTGNFTLEAWIKTNSNTTQQSIIEKYDNSSLNGYLLRLTSSGTIMAGTMGTASNVLVTGNAVLSTNTWYHVAATYNGSNIYIYINGVLDKTGAATVNPGASTFSLKIGARGNDAGTTFNGLIDEVRISNAARTANEIAESYKLGKDSYINQTLNTIDLSTKNTMAINVASDRPGTYLSTTWGESAFANYQPDANTVGLWPMDEISGSGAYMKDISGSSNSGTPTGTTYTSSGKLGGARSFNGSSDVITVTRNTAINSTFDGSYTLGVWINSSSTTSLKRIWGFYDASSGYHTGMLNYPTTGKIRFHGGSGLDADALVSSRSDLNNGLWHYVVFQIDGTAQRIYIDGVLDASKTRVAGTASDAALYIGKSTSGTLAAEHFAGTMDEIRLDNTARTADQIRQAYEVGLRTHNITVTFGAGLASGNLISNSGDTSFSIDATKYGLPSLGSELYAGDKVIVKENYDGTEYIAQGTVTSVNLSTGATVVSSWDSGSTFPSGGYTVNADVFKWQKEYIPVKNRTISTQVDATNLLTFRLNDGNEGRNIWIDDLRSSTGYLKNSSNEIISFASNAQYVQYKTIFNSWDSNVTPYISQVQVDYISGGPTIDQLMRHGQWFDSSGAKKGFWWVGTH